MAVLAEADRAKMWRGMMRFLSRRATEFPYNAMTKAEGRAGIDGVDDGLNAALASINGGLPEPFATQAGVNMKALFLCMDAAYRVDGTGDFAKALFGEMD